MEIAIENSCRICMLSSCTLVDIFEEHEGSLLSELISEISGVNIEVSDCLSKKVCKECESKTLELHAFRQLCIDSDETVRYNLLLADEEVSGIEVNDDDDDFNKGKEVEYFIEDNESVQQIEQEAEYQPEEEQLEYQTEEEQLEYHQELFANDENQSVDHHVLAAVESIDENSYEMNSIVIERKDTKESLANKVILISGDDLITKMREAHFAKEQKKKHKCPHCDKFFTFPSKVNRHVQAVHKNIGERKLEPMISIAKRHQCNICFKAFVSQFKVKRHMSVHNTELKMGLQKNWSKNYFLCEVCDKKFHTHATFDRHKLICDLLQKSIIKRSEDHSYCCCICAQTFNSHDDMVEHMKSHEETEHNCLLCSEPTSEIILHLNDMIRHGKYHEENVTYQCCVCQKLYPNGEEIVTHMLRHKDYKPFKCKECGKAFFDKYKLRQHFNTHDPNVPKNYVCDICSRAFAAQDYLNCHVRRKHADSKPYQCGFCPKSFAFLHDLNLHSSNHTGDKRHVCQICDSSFTKAWSLKQHMTLHESNVQNCHICDFTAPTKARLQAHMTTHVDSQSAENTLEESSYTYIAVNVEADHDQENYNLVEIQTSY